MAGNSVTLFKKILQHSECRAEILHMMFRDASVWCLPGSVLCVCMHILQRLHVPDRPYDISEKIKMMGDCSPVVSFEADPVF